MADVAGPLGVAAQIRLVAGLRWRILHNSLRRKNNRLDLIGLIVIGIVAAVAVLGLCLAFFAGGYSFLSTEKAAWMGLLFWGIFIWWQLFPVFAAGFGASFEFRTLLRFPLSLSAFYAIGLTYGLADFGAIAGLCWLIAAASGSVAARPAVLPVVLAVAVVFTFLNVALERLLGSWLERLLARRRTRELFFALFILLMISLQLIGPILNRYGDAAAPAVMRLLPYLAPLPPSLAGRAVAAAASGDPGEAFLCITGLSLYALLFGALLWLRFRSQYGGEETADTPAPTKLAVRPASSSTKSFGDAFTLLSPQVASVVRKEFLYLMRNGFSALLLLLPPLLVFILISQATLVHFSGSAHGISPELFFPGLVAYLVLILMAPAYNSFAYENAGIQTYFTAPLRFRSVFLGKNFIQVGLITLELSLCILAFSYRVGLPSPPVFVATLAAVVFTVVGQLSIANWSSVSFPRKLAFGQMHGQRQSGMAVLVAFCAQILLFAISSLIFMLGRWTGDRWLPAKAFALLAVAAVGGYLAALDALTQLAEKKKETLIEALCK